MAKKKKQPFNEVKAWRTLEDAVAEKAQIAPVLKKLQAEMETSEEAKERIDKE